MDQHKLNLQRAVREQRDRDIQEEWDKRREHDDVVELLQQQLHITTDKLEAACSTNFPSNKIIDLKKQIDRRDDIIMRNRRAISELKDDLKHIRKRLEKTPMYYQL